MEDTQARELESEPAKLGNIAAPTMGSKAPFIAAGLTVLLCILLGNVIVALFTAIGCGGDGGSPYAAIASPRGQLCESSAAGFLGALQLFLAPAVVTVGVGIAATRRSWRQLGATAAVGVVLIVAPFLIFNAIPNECTPEQQAAGLSCEVY